MTIAPFLARVPYNAAAVAPFSTEISSMSSGFKLERLSPQFGSSPLFSPNLVLSIGIPLITYKGWLSPAIEVFPRIVTRVEHPGPDPTALMLGPDTFSAYG